MSVPLSGWDDHSLSYLTDKQGRQAKIIDQINCQVLFSKTNRYQCKIALALKNQNAGFSLEKESSLKLTFLPRRIVGKMKGLIAYALELMIQKYEKILHSANFFALF